jgi:hypothetical protein
MTLPDRGAVGATTARIAPALVTERLPNKHL